MGRYTVTITNDRFSDSGEQDAPNVTKAWQRALTSAITIAGEHIAYGNPFFGAVVTLEEGGNLLGRYVVSVGATALSEEGAS